MNDRAISLAQILGRPVCNAVGMRIGRVSDVVVRWDAGSDYPPVTWILVRVRRGDAVVRQADVTLSQTEVRLRIHARMVWRPVWGDGDVALAREVLDRQVVDTSGVQVVRAADAYLVDGPQGWELAGIDVGLRSFGRRLFLPPMGSAKNGPIFKSVAALCVARALHTRNQGMNASDPTGSSGSACNEQGAWSVDGDIQRSVVLSAVTSTTPLTRLTIKGSETKTLDESERHHEYSCWAAAVEN